MARKSLSLTLLDWFWSPYTEGQNRMNQALQAASDKLDAAISTIATDEASLEDFSLAMKVARDASEVARLNAESDTAASAQLVSNASSLLEAAHEKAQAFLSSNSAPPVPTATPSEPTPAEPANPVITEAGPDTVPLPAEDVAPAPAADAPTESAATDTVPSNPGNNQPQ